MKRILFIAAHSFPVRSSECICNSKVAFSLAEAGYKVDVFTYNAKGSYPADAKIDTLLRDSPNLTIYEIENKNNNCFLSRTNSIKDNVKNLLTLLRMSFKVGYMYNGMAPTYDIWNYIKTYIDSLDEFPYDVVMTRAYNAELAAIYLKNHYGVCWLANWDDPYPLERFPIPYGKGPNAKIHFGYKRVYKKVKKMVDLHSFPSDRLRNYMVSSFNTVKLSKTMVIPHMAHSKLLPEKHAAKDGCLKLVSCGSVSSPRDPTLFLDALKEVGEELHLTSKDIQCFFVGKYDSSLANKVEERNLDKIVKMTGPKQYADCLDFIASCDLSLIIEAQCEEGIYLPTKFADAVQCRVPVFCVSPLLGTLHDLVDKFHNGYFCDNNSKESICNVLKMAILDYKKDKLPIVSKSQLEYFFEDSIVKQYESQLEKIL